MYTKFTLDTQIFNFVMRNKIKGTPSCNLYNLAKCILGLGEGVHIQGRGKKSCL